MPLSFTATDDPPLVETVYDDDASLADSVPGDDVSEATDEVSMSDYEGDISNAPRRMYFGPKECLAIFEQPSDRSAFLRVCGREHTACKRNHAVLDRAKEGFYDTVAARKFLDGKLHTFQSKKERDAELIQAKAARDAQLAESAKYLSSLEGEGKSSFALQVPVWGKDSKIASVVETRSPWKEASPTLVALEAKVEPDPSIQGLRGSLKKAPPPFVAPEAKVDIPPPERAIEFMMGALTDTLQGLRNDMQDLRGHISPDNGSGLGPSPPSGFPPSAPPPVAPPLGGGATLRAPRGGLQPVATPTTEWWYAVYKGKDGSSGVFPSWAEASPLVLGVSGALVKKFRTFDEAMQFLRGLQASEANYAFPGQERTTVPDSIWYAVAKGKHGICNVFESWEAASEVFLGVPGAVVQKFRTRAEALEFLESFHKGSSEGEEPSISPNPRPPNLERTSQDHHPKVQGDQGYIPPLVLAGPDPSTKQSDKVFGLDLGSEWELRAALLPPGLPVGVGRGLTNSLTDTVAVPGMFTAVSEESSEGNEMALLGAAMEELANQQSRNQNEGMATKTDLHWQSGKRTSLRQVKSLEMLRKRIAVLLKLRNKILKQTIISVRNACKQGGWQDLDRIEAWAHGGYLTRITRDALDYYLSLHQHLMGLSSGGAPWDYVKMELDHHVEELGLIRATADSRLQAILFLYAYLRDGQDKNWHSDSLQYKRNMDIFSRQVDGVGFSGNDDSINENSSGPCPKCLSSLHAGGRDNCPWNNNADSVARRNAAKVLRNLVNSTPPVVPP